MYRLGRRQVHHYILYGLVGLVVLALSVAGVLAARHYFQPRTVLKQSPPVVHVVAGDATATTTITKGIFTLQLPDKWRAVTAPPLNYTIYSWAGTGAGDAARRLDVYVDGVPPDAAFNRLLPVQAAGNQLEVTGSVSDNCTSFTDKTAASTKTGAALSKWGGVNFWCDMVNYERDVVAIGSTEGINRVTLHGARSGTHHILLVYTDHNAAPDYTVFTAIIKSFHLL